MNYLNIYLNSQNYYQYRDCSKNYLSNETNNHSVNSNVAFKSNSIKNLNIIKEKASSKASLGILGTFGALVGSISLFNNSNIKETKLIKNESFEIPNNKIKKVTLRLGEIDNNQGVDFPLDIISKIIDSLYVGETIRIGRDANCDICLPNWCGKIGVSRNHLELTKTQNGIIVKDTSSYGTIINSKNKTDYSIKMQDLIITAVPVYKVDSEENIDINNKNLQDRIRTRKEELDRYISDPAKRVQVSPAELDKYISKIAETWAYFEDNQEEKLKIYTQELNQNRKHIEFILSRPDLFSNPKPPIKRFATWNEFSGNGSNQHIAWKMHIFSNTSNDWQTLAETIIPYLKDKGINFKTFNIGCTPESLKDKQNGKAFTIYPSSIEEMAQVARDLDYIIRKNKLEKKDSNIIGDAKLGDSGRLFYRYEYRSKNFKDEVVNVSENYNYYRYQLYEKNRGNGPNAHLAQDMTVEDDIWKDFDLS